jgi:hypothetical protein
MKVLCLSRLLGLLTWFGVSATLSAAPPKVDYLFPAGAQRGSSVSVTASGAFERWPVKAWTDAKGIDIKPGKLNGKLTITVAKDAEPGVCWIRLYDDQGASALRPFIVGMLPDVLETEPNDDPKLPQILQTSSVVVNGRLDKPNDVDTFAVKLSKGQTLVASLEAHETLRSPMDGVLQILSADGFVLERNDDYHGLDPQIAFTAPKEGTYLARVFAFPSKADSSIRFAGKETFVYRLTLTTDPFVEYTYPLAISSQGQATVDLIGWNLTDPLRSFPIIPQKGAALMKRFDTRIANPFFVRVEPTQVLAHRKTRRDAPSLVTLPIAITSRIDNPGENDVYRFAARKGQKLAFRIESVSLGFSLDPVLRLTTETGKTLQQVSSKKIGAEPSLDYTVAQDGELRLEVSDLHGHAGMRYVYLLRIGILAPDFALKAASDTFTLASEKSLDIPITTTRLGGHNQAITYTVEGLPNEIRVTSSGKALTLKSATGKFAFSGPIRILGTAKDGVIRSASAPNAELGRSVEHFWLTAVAGK